jgi:hypothetical protein
VLAKPLSALAKLPSLTGGAGFSSDHLILYLTIAQWLAKGIWFTIAVSCPLFQFFFFRFRFAMLLVRIED